MKRVLVILFVTLSAAYVSAQSLKETTDWLHTFVSARGVLYLMGGDFIERWTVSFKGTTMTIHLSTDDRTCLRTEACGADYTGKIQHAYFRQKFSLADIDPSSIVYGHSRDPKFYSVLLFTTNLRNLMSYETLNNGKWVVVKDEHRKHEGYFGVCDEESARRIVKALRHAVGLAAASRRFSSERTSSSWKSASWASWRIFSFIVAHSPKRDLSSGAYNYEYDAVVLHGLACMTGLAAVTANPNLIP